MIIFTCTFWACTETTDLQFEVGKSSQPSTEPTIEPSEESQTDITFYRDIQPVLNRACIHCHTATGRSFSMESAELVVLFADIIARDVREGGKPPFIGDPSCRNYHGSELFLTEEEIVMFERWAEEETPIGDIANAQEPSFLDSIAPYDVEIALPSGFDMPDWEEDRCVVYEVGNSTELRINALEFQTNDINVVHHSVLYLLPDDWNGTTETFSCSWSGEDDWKAIAAWRPGSPSIQFSGENGIILPPNSKLMSQVYLINETQERHQFDKEAIWGLNLAFGSGNGYHLGRFEVRNYTIPKDATSHVESSDRTWEYPDANIMGVILRSDILNQGQWFHSKGTEGVCIGDVGGNDGLNPMTYIFHEPISITTGTPIEIGCQWNNSRSNPKLPTPQVYDVPFGYNQTGSVCSAELILEWK